MVITRQMNCGSVRSKRKDRRRRMVSDEQERLPPRHGYVKPNPDLADRAAHFHDRCHELEAAIKVLRRAWEDYGTDRVEFPAAVLEFFKKVTPPDPMKQQLVKTLEAAHARFSTAKVSNAEILAEIDAVLRAAKEAKDAIRNDRS
jgi:hypothetical protein